MPITRTHRKDHTPLAEWPDDTQVQWGDGGLVISRGGNYTTAFFEAFPAEGGFFRGEGATISEAEAACLSKVRRFLACTHRWGRQGYTNGGAKCHRCGAFSSNIFAPIRDMQAYRAPISLGELHFAFSGYLRPLAPDEDRDPEERRRKRRSQLRLKRAGIDLPAIPEKSLQEMSFDELASDPYKAACRRAVAGWYRVHREDLGARWAREKGQGLEHLFSALELKEIEEEADRLASDMQEGA